MSMCYKISYYILKEHAYLFANRANIIFAGQSDLDAAWLNHKSDIVQFEQDGIST